MSYGEWLEFYLLYTRLVVVVHVIRVLVVVEFSEVGLCLTVCGSLRDQQNGN